MIRDTTLSRQMFAACVLVAAAVVPGANALAQEEFLASADQGASEEVEGWLGALELGATFMLDTNKRVVGQQDGSTLTFGARIVGDLDYQRGGHDWVSDLFLRLQYQRTPALDELLKSADEARFSTAWYYRGGGQTVLGPYVRAEAATALLPGWDVRAGEVTFVYTDDSGNVQSELSDRFQLTESLSPLLLSESAGLFVRPQSFANTVTEFRTGIGVQETLADGSFVVSDDEATDEIELSVLSSSTTMGAVAALSADGATDDGDLTWGLALSSLFPMVEIGDVPESDFADRIQLQIDASLSSKLTSWASLTYDFGADRVPSVSEDWQLSHRLSLVLSHSQSWRPSEEGGNE